MVAEWASRLRENEPRSTVLATETGRIRVGRSGFDGGSVLALEAGHVGPLQKERCGPTMKLTLNRAALTARFGQAVLVLQAPGRPLCFLGVSSQ